MIDFSPSEEDLAEISRKIENDEIEFHVWDFVNEGTDATVALDIAKAVAEAERDGRRWACAVVGEGDEERLVLEPLG